MRARFLICFLCIMAAALFCVTVACAALDYQKLIKSADSVMARVQQLLNTKPASGLAQTAIDMGQKAVPGLLQNYEKTVKQVMDGVNTLKAKGLSFISTLEALKASNLANLDTLKPLLVKSGLTEPVKQALGRTVSFLNKVQEQCNVLSASLPTQSQ